MPTLSSPLTPLLLSRIRERGPLTVAEFMELALYHPEHGYYARAAQRSGREGDFFTSVDVGPLFGEILAVQIDEIWRVLRSWLPPSASARSASADRQSPGDGWSGGSTFDVVEAGAGNGRLTRDILAAAAAEALEFLPHARVTLVERSATARAAHAQAFSTVDAPAGPAFRSGEQDIAPVSRADLPSHVTGVIFANELLDALPVHVVEATGTDLDEVYVGVQGDRLVETRGPLSTPAIAEYVSSVGIRPPPGTRIEVGLEAARWIGAAAAALDRGFLILFDYGHEARELYSQMHAAGTLTTYRRHSVGARHWLGDPGEADLTAHVNLTAIRRAAEGAGLETLGIVDQMYFLTSLGIVERLPDGADRRAISRRLAAKTLLMPGGLGSTMKVMGFAKHVGSAALRGLSSGRMT